MATSPPSSSPSSANRRPTPEGNVPQKSSQTDVLKSSRSPAETYAALQKSTRQISNIQTKQPDSRPLGSTPVRKSSPLQNFIGSQQADARSYDDPRSDLSDDSVSPEDAPSVLNQGQDDPFPQFGDPSDESEDETGKIQTKPNDGAASGAQKNAAFQEEQKKMQRTQDRLIPPNANQDEGGGSEMSAAPNNSTQAQTPQKPPDPVNQLKTVLAGLNALKQQREEAGDERSLIASVLENPVVRSRLKTFARQASTGLTESGFGIPIAAIISVALFRDDLKDPNATTGEKLTDGMEAATNGVVTLLGLFLIFMALTPLMLPFVAHAMGPTWMTQQFGPVTAAVFTPFY